MSNLNSIFITTAKLTQNSGGGTVSYHELEALKRISDVKMALSLENIYPPKRGLPDSPFLYDYIASSLIDDNLSSNNIIDIIVTNGNPFGQTVRKLKSRNPDIKIIVDCPAHNLERSIEEFKILGLNYPFNHMTDPYLWDLYTVHYKEATVMMCPCKYSAEYIKKKMGFDSLEYKDKKIVVIPHGCNIPDISEVKYPPDGMFVVGYLGMNGPDKGLIYLVNSWNKLISNNILNKEKTKILVAGYGTESLGGLGHINNPADIYKNISVYVQPSVTEGFGLEVLEAMSYRKPVIVSEGAGAHEIIEDGVDGFVVPIRDPEKISEKILYFYNNPNEVIRMGKNAREKSLFYDWKNIEGQYQKIYLS